MYNFCEAVTSVSSISRIAVQLYQKMGAMLNPFIAKHPQQLEPKPSILFIHSKDLVYSLAPLTTSFAYTVQRPHPRAPLTQSILTPGPALSKAYSTLSPHLNTITQAIKDETARLEKEAKSKKRSGGKKGSNAVSKNATQPSIRCKRARKDDDKPLGPPEKKRRAT